MICFQVFNRFWFHLPVAWTEEAARYLFVWLSLIGVIRSVRERANIEVDLFVQMLPPRLQAAVDVLANVLLLVFLAALFYSSMIMLPMTARRRISTMNISAFYLYVAIPISASLMILFTLKNMLEAFKRTRKAA